MNTTSLIEKIAKIDEYFRSTNDAISEKERIFSRVVKLNEEVGELCEAALYEHDKNQREKGKGIDFDAELADVMICTLLLAQRRQKDIWLEIDKKLEKQFNRFNLH
jgi:NTP pyrophosphatase (non-canonical NTP hydrolase)